MTLFQAILEKIKAYDTIIIHRHQRPDPDAIGSQIGLKEILKTNFSDKKILATGINEPTLSWIAEMDEVPDNDYEGALVIVPIQPILHVLMMIVMIRETFLSKLTIILMMMLMETCFWLIPLLQVPAKL